ncbi:MAG: hypothetical protein KJ043_04670, partial [Anaerolineae bacterium]|nr:hypothetical protein [Anaerolineae bacterium]
MLADTNLLTNYKQNNKIRVENIILTKKGYVMKIRHNFILGYILILIVGLSTLANNQTITITAQSDFDFIEQFNDNTLNWLTQDDTNVTANIVDGKYRITMPEDGDIHQFITYPDFSTAPKVMGDYEYRFEMSEGSCGEPEFCFLIMAFNVREGQDQMTYVLYISRERRLLYRFNGNRIQGTRTDSSDLPDVFNGGTHNSVVRATADELTWHVNNRLIARFTGATEFNGTIGFGVTRYSDNSRALSLAFDNVTIQSIGNRPALIASPTPLTIANNTSDNFNNAVNLYWQNNDSEGALSLFDEVISSNQTLADAYAWRAKIRLEATTIARNEIERDINTALDIDPDNALALAVRSIYAMYNRNQASATRDIERALAIAPDNVDVISAIAQAYTFGYMHEEALAILQTLNPFPDYPRLYYQRALVYLLGLQDSDNAKLDLQRTIQLDNSFVNAYISLAQIYFQEEQPILVLENILRARQFDPNAGVDYANRVFLNYWFVRPSDFEGIVNISTTGLNIP